MVWPPGQPADVKSGRLVFNTNIHGAVFNTAAGKQTLAQFLDKLRRNTASVFPPASFGRMVLNGGSGLRLVNEASYLCSCECECGPGRRLCAASSRLWGQEKMEVVVMPCKLLHGMCPALLQSWPV